jgi:hypothetical protein
LSARFHSTVLQLIGRLMVGLIAACLCVVSGGVSASDLPERTGPPIEVTEGVPHVQINVEPVPELHEELLRRVALLPGLEVRPTVIGMYGTKGFWLLEDLKLSNPQAIYRGREFAHLHVDGSLHASLAPERALEAVSRGWAVRHPSAQYHARIQGFVMLHTPGTAAELDVIFRLIVDGYNFVSGQDIQAADYR